MNLLTQRIFAERIASFILPKPIDHPHVNEFSKLARLTSAFHELIENMAIKVWEKGWRQSSNNRGKDFVWCLIRGKIHRVTYRLDESSKLLTCSKLDFHQEPGGTIVYRFSSSSGFINRLVGVSIVSLLDMIQLSVRNDRDFRFLVKTLECHTKRYTAPAGGGRMEECYPDVIVVRGLLRFMVDVDALALLEAEAMNPTYGTSYQRVYICDQCS